MNARDLPEFDFSHAVAAVQAIEKGDDTAALAVAGLPATGHLARHQALFGGRPIPAEKLTRELLLPLEAHRDELDETRRVLAAARRALREALDRGPHGSWLRPLYDLLPAGHSLAATTLYITFGYDIGVVSDPSAASVNVAHRLLRHRPESFRYYAIHELHHAGFLAYQPPPGWGTGGLPALFPSGANRDSLARRDLEHVVGWLTQLEGMGVYAALEPRARAGLLEADPDYVTLSDTKVMDSLERRYWGLVDGLAGLPERVPLDALGQALEAFGEPDKLFHLVGCRVAARIDRELGRDALVRTIEEGPGPFLAMARALGEEGSA